MTIPFHIIKKVIVIRETKYNYCIDEDGNGIAWIDGYVILFFVNMYGETLIGSIKCYVDQ